MAKPMTRDGNVKAHVSLSTIGAVVGRNGYWPIRGVDVTKTFGLDDWGKKADWVRFEGRGSTMKVINGGIRIEAETMDRIVAWYLNNSAKRMELIQYIATYITEEMSDNLCEDNADEVENAIYSAIEAYNGRK